MGREVISLTARAVSGDLESTAGRMAWRIGEVPRADHAQLVHSADQAREGFGLYLMPAGSIPTKAPGPWMAVPQELDYLRPGDVVGLTKNNTGLRVLWRRKAPINAVLLTEQCENRCLMCSQPPRRADDRWLLRQASEMIDLLDACTEGILFTGGEPTVFGDGLTELLSQCRSRLPDAQIHLLSNGRRFRDAKYATSLVHAGGSATMVGIPIYGSDPSLHDFIVQAHGAFNETIQGILNLAATGGRVEIRVVLQKRVAPWLTEIAEFITRNLPFVEQVALMGLEFTGLARRNEREVWIDPAEYRDELTQAALRLSSAGISTRIYNHQLRVTDTPISHLAVQSISDWKNEYLPSCETCAARRECGGFFSTAAGRISEHIHPITADSFAIGMDPPTAPHFDGTPVSIRSIYRQRNALATSPRSTRDQAPLRRERPRDTVTERVRRSISRGVGSWRMKL